MRRTLPTPCLWQIALALDEAHRSSSLPFLPVQFLEKKPSDALVVMAMYSASHDERTIDSDCRSVCVATLHSGKSWLRSHFSLCGDFLPNLNLYGPPADLHRCSGFLVPRIKHTSSWSCSWHVGCIPTCPLQVKVLGVPVAGNPLEYGMSVDLPVHVCSAAIGAISTM